jgi:hypothetical protein
VIPQFKFKENLTGNHKIVEEIEKFTLVPVFISSYTCSMEPDLFTTL